MRVASITETLEAGVQGGVAPAMAACVLRHGEAIHESWHGCAELVPRRRPLEPGDLFDVASLTKILCTTTLAAILVDRGRLALERTVASYGLGLDSEAQRAISVRQLLAHTSGLAAWRRYFEAVAQDAVGGVLFRPPAERPPSLAEAAARGRTLIRSAVEAETLEAPPGARATYSDLGFMVLGWLIETVAGASLDELFAEEIAGPLGLGDTFFLGELDPGTPARRRKHRFAATEVCEHRHETNCGTVNDDNAWAMGGVGGHAGLFSTPRSCASIGQVWLDALCGRPALVRQETAAEFACRQPPAGSTRALGWDTPSETDSSAGRCFGRGRIGAIGHLGFTGTSLWLDIDKDVACVLLTNRVHPTRSNEGIKSFRPRFHDVVAAALEMT